MKDMIKTGLFLLAFSAVAGFLLALTEMVTAPEIEKNNRLAEEKARKEALPGSVAFKSLKIEGNPAGDLLNLGFDKDGKFLGTVVKVAPKGYGGPIEIVMGINPDMSVSGVKIQSLRETPGLGTKLQEKFLTNFNGICQEKKSALRPSLKKDGGDIDGITAATVSSRAFCRGVTQGIEFVKSCKEKITTESTTPPKPDSGVQTGTAPTSTPSPTPSTAPVPATTAPVPTPPSQTTSPVAPAPTTGPTLAPSASGTPQTGGQ